METAIEIEGLCKRFGQKDVLREVSLSVKSGEIYGFLGLNGAGKTTTMRVILNMIQKDRGEVKVFGASVTGRGFDWNQVGFLIETPKSYPNLTVAENLKIAALNRGCEPGRLTEVLGRLGLDRYTKVLAKHLSLGNKQRLGIAKALIHKPRLLILDEPINGLDPEGIAEIRELIYGLAREEGVTIFVSSHLLDEVAKIADTIGIIHDGTIIKQTRYEELEASLKQGTLIKTRDDSRALAVLRDRGLSATAMGNGGFLIGPGIEAQPEEINSWLVEASCPPYELGQQEIGLEEYFLKLVDK